MRTLYILKKCILEIVRDWKILLFSLIFGPFFVGVFYIAFNSDQTSYKVIISNYDKEISTVEKANFNGGNELFELLKGERNTDGSLLYNVTLENDKDKAIEELKSKKYDIYISIPEDFSQSIVKQIENPVDAKTKLNFYGDIGSNKYIVPAVTIGSISEELVNSMTGKSKALSLQEESIISYENRTEFEATMPSAIFIGIIMLVFTSAIALIKEVEAGTIRRLQISKTSTKELLSAITISQLLVGVISIAITLFTAMIIFNAKTDGSLRDICIISILCCFSIIAIGFIIASVSRNVSDILIIGNIPYFLLFILSGAFPIPRANLLFFGEHSIALNDIFPTTPAMTALKAIMDQGKDLNDVMFEIIIMLVLTIIYFAVGIYLFNRRHMKLT